MKEAAPPLKAAPSKRRRFRPVPWMLAALLLAGVAQTAMARGSGGEGALWYALAGLALLRAISFGLPQETRPLVWNATAIPSAPSLLLMLAGMFGIAAGGWRVAAGEQVFAPSLWLLAAGTAALLAGAAGVDRLPFRKRSMPPEAQDLYFPQFAPSPAQRDKSDRPTWRWWAALAAITALALALRLVWLESLPFGVWFDEALIGLEAAKAAHNPGFRPLYSQGTSSPAVFIYAVAASLGAFGQEAGPLRLVSALAGTLTAPMFGLLLRELTGRRAALAGAFLMATARWDLTFSRLAMQGATTPLFACLTLWLLLSGLRRGSLVRLALAGVTAGFGLLYYTAFFFVLPLLAGLLALTWVTARP
ncbi:MAG: glycosyltransferase family 39 protein, partial [Chloroflexi bacterium]|nr:glycosyltransferase family 39 protein [Chloroflexota bacterium]